MVFYRDFLYVFFHFLLWGQVAKRKFFFIGCKNAKKWEKGHFRHLASKENAKKGLFFGVKKVPFLVKKGHFLAIFDQFWSILSNFGQILVKNGAFLIGGQKRGFFDQKRGVFLTKNRGLVEKTGHAQRPKKYSATHSTETSWQKKHNRNLHQKYL